MGGLNTCMKGLHIKGLKGTERNRRMDALNTSKKGLHLKGLKNTARNGRMDAGRHLNGFIGRKRTLAFLA
jgi:hypothetical protein